MSLARPTLAVFAAAFIIVPSARISMREPVTPAKKAKVECAADNGGLTLPKGFCAFIVADKLTTPRHLIVMPNGDLFVSSSRNGVIALRDTTGDGKADVIQEWGGGIHSSEVAIHGGYLYSDNTTAIVRYPLKDGSLTPAGPVETFIGGLPGGGHSAKTFTIADDGTMYVNIGSRTNSCQQADRQLESAGIDPCVERETRAGIWAFRTDHAGQTATDGVHFGTGIRNSVSITINPTDKTLYVMQHGRDQLAQNWPKLFDEAKSAETPAEEMFHISKGDDFGWPYCYYDRQQGKKVLAPEFGGDGKTVGKCANYKSNVASFPGHWAPNSLAFYAGKSFPARYRNGAFIAFHGSWNRAPLPQGGYNVVFQPLANGKASGDFEIFADGFRPATAGAAGTMHRPTGLAVGPDGSLYITDDASGTIWRVMYTGK
ncbi:MAG: PQQ-dependent sugar dehydrogenase [bacterium]